MMSRPAAALVLLCAAASVVLVRLLLNSRLHWHGRSSSLMIGLACGLALGRSVRMGGAGPSVKPQTQAIAGAATGSAFLVGGLIAPILWALYVIIAIGVVQRARTRSFGIGFWTALLAVTAFVAVRMLLDHV
ncbi:hypothetical protein Gbro_4651 [Gordonia bronchialis DSM 43247]|uniref:Uncharacterized protein n=1 Tax=Gordonia bronchialis (strain ATCC 25592 / DSM 43247 / BCRC 13721 / JCM 3198 / KCTC 3076 / NBRC 16047 / NCTC 10667) TaxID=526226 RepID=D0L7I8_GORB4|nr:hypothetical protein [Gordonia bronchialis]ACY23777.1 hypothetical protein Gbro_4651 [Gordonia bronchialis DSM 43247]MCC3321945.1 hypothetical protein [Gordonia bronchialis]STQ66794.1 Uncharacterised protein [Gordonia bronchialis]